MKYLVHVPIQGDAVYEIIADNPEEAINGVESGRGRYLSSDTCCEDPDIGMWIVEEIE